MAFTPAVAGINYEGNQKIVYGTYVNDGGSTGGDVITGLSTVEQFRIDEKGSGVIATRSVVNETLPLSNSTGAVTIVTSANESGMWEAKGN